MDIGDHFAVVTKKYFEMWSKQWEHQDTVGTLWGKSRQPVRIQPENRETVGNSRETVGNSRETVGKQSENSRKTVGKQLETIGKQSETVGNNRETVGK